MKATTHSVVVVEDKGSLAIRPVVGALKCATLTKQ